MISLQDLNLFRLKWFHQEEWNDKYFLISRSTLVQNSMLFPEINPCTYGYLFLTKEARIFNGTKTASSINGAGKTGQLHVKEWN